MRSDFKTMDIVEMEMSTNIGRIQLAGGSWNHAINQQARMANHHLEFSMLSPEQTAQGTGRFIEYWSDNRFEPFGGLFFLPAESQIHFKSQVRQRQALVCEFIPDQIEQLLEQDLSWDQLELEKMIDMNDANIRQLFKQIYQEIRQPGFAKTLMLESLATQLAVELARHIKSMDEKNNPGKIASWRLRLIDQRLSDMSSMPTQEELAELCCLSVRHLCRAFREARGQTLGNYVAEHRANHAKDLIASGMSIKSVAYTMGFSAPSNFTRAFFRVTGETPKDYRQRVQARKKHFLLKTHSDTH